MVGRKIPGPLTLRSRDQKYRSNDGHSNRDCRAPPRNRIEDVKILEAAAAVSELAHDSNGGRVRSGPTPADFPVTKNEPLSFIGIPRFDAGNLDSLARAIIPAKAIILVFCPDLDIPN
jgi:hypothetical protein